MSDEQIAVEAMDSDVPVGDGEPSVGSESEASVGAEPFFTWTGKDGQEQSFKNKGELATFLSHSGMRREELDREKAALKKQGETYGTRLQELQAKEASLNERFAKINQIDQFLKNTPGLEKDLDSLKARYQNRGASSELAKQMLEEELGPIKQELEERKKADAERAEAERRERALQAAAKNVEGFNRDAALQYMKKIQDAPEEAQLEMLYAMLHYASVGESSPAQIEQKIAESAAKKRPPSVTSTPGRATKGGADPKDMSWADARRAATEMLGE